MKKKLLIIIPICVLLLAVLCFFLFIPKKNYLVMTLDINPSFELHLNEKYMIQDVIMNNSDAEELLIGNFKNKSLDNFFQSLSKKIMNSKYTEFNQLSVLFYVDPKLNQEKVKEMFLKPYDEKEIAIDFIFVENITQEDEKLAKKYHISPAKASYFRKIKSQNNKISYESLLEKSIQEIRNMKDTGFYCDEGYELDGERCIKEVRRESAKRGDICPNASISYEGKCYSQGRTHDKKGSYFCRDDYMMTEDNKCKKLIEEEPIGICPDGGEFHPEENICEIKKHIGDAVEICRITPESDMLMDHKCYGPKPMINGGCLGGDSIVNGWCIDYSSYYPSDWKCPDGSFISRPDGSVPDDHGCYEVQFVEPTSYRCSSKDFKLKGKKCIQEIVEKAEEEKECDDGFTLVDNAFCINMNQEVSFVNGLFCDMPNSRLDGNVCVIYESVDAKK